MYKMYTLFSCSDISDTELCSGECSFKSYSIMVAMET
jgi:hypothetical protein